MYHDKTEVVCVLGKRNKNDRIYTRETFKNLPESLPVTIGCCDTAEIPADKVIGRATNLRFEGNALVADIKIDNPLTPLPTRFMSFVTSSVGCLDDDNVVEDCSLTSISMIPSNTSAFRVTLWDRIKLLFRKLTNSLRRTNSGVYSGVRADCEDLS